MKLTPEQLRQNAAAMIAFADGKPIQCRWHGGEWKDVTGACWDFEACEYRPRPRPWSLPAPPAGRKWHREDWVEEMLPVIDGKQTRPLLEGEVIQAKDRCQYPPELEDGGWHEPGGGAEGLGCSPYHFHFRTTRPLPKEPTVRWWNKPEDVPSNPLLFIRHRTGACYLLANVAAEGCWMSHGPIWEWAALDAYSTDRKTWLPCTVTET